MPERATESDVFLHGLGVEDREALTFAFFDGDHDCAHNMVRAYAVVAQIIAERVAQALTRAADELGSGPKMRVLVERESCDWWTEQSVSGWLRERAERLSPPEGSAS